MRDIRSLGTGLARQLRRKGIAEPASKALEATLCWEPAAYARLAVAESELAWLISLSSSFEVFVAG